MSRETAEMGMKFARFLMRHSLAFYTEYSGRVLSERRRANLQAISSRIQKSQK